MMFHAVMYNEKSGKKEGESFFAMTKEYFNKTYVPNRFKGAKHLGDDKYLHPFMKDVIITCEPLEE